MQEALGADFTDRIWSAQPSADDLATDNGLPSLPSISFPPLIRADARRADALDGVSRGRRLPEFLSQEHLTRLAGSRRVDIDVDPADGGDGDRFPLSVATTAPVQHAVGSSPASSCARQAARRIAVVEI